MEYGSTPYVGLTPKKTWPAIHYAKAHFRRKRTFCGTKSLKRSMKRPFVAFDVLRWLLQTLPLL